LVKKICIHCKKKVELLTTEARLLATDLSHVYEGAGCPKCNNTGYSGRLAVFETVLVDGHLEDLISRGASLEDLRNYAKEKKIPMLRDEVMNYVQSGTTTVEEALRILYNVEN
jgi:type IV pilus assembly protein PilB